MIKNKKLMKKLLAVMSVVAFGASFVNLSEAAIGHIPSISSRNHNTMQGRQGRNNDRFNNDSRNNNRRTENQAPAPREDRVENINVNDVQPHEPRVESNRGNNNSRIGNRRNENNSRRMETPAKIVRDIDRTHDATYDEDDRYRAERESYYENDGNGRIVDHQIETIDDRHRASATESDRERGHETIINRYDDEEGRRGSQGSRSSRDNGGITVVVNNNIPIENNVNVDVKAENKNENKNDIKLENNNKVTSTNNNSNDNDNTNKTEANVSGGSTGGTMSESKPMQKWQKGDVNRNGILDEDDLALVQKMVLEELEYDELADWDNNGRITATDLSEEKHQVEKAIKERENTNTKKLWGDLNKDGVLTKEDILLLEDFVFENKGNFTLKEADFTKDGKINLYDILRLIECVYDGKSLGYIDDEPQITVVERPSISCINNKKPVIYLYPTEAKNILVNLFLDGEITCTYPKLNECWDVIAEPDGTLTDKRGKHYNYLFWEGITHKPMDFSTGFCVAGKDVEEFLQEKLSYMGMNEKEINDFMVYWLPQLQDNPYNIISFQKNNYVETAVLNVTPAPDTSIRVFMAWKKSADKVDIKPQQLDKIERKGFTLVEWGGGEVTDDSSIKFQ